MDYSRAPAPWSIETTEATGDEVLRLGRRTVRVADISGCASETAVELNIDGHFAAVALFMAAGAGLVMPVALGILNPRFLAGGILFTGIGLMVLQDIFRGHRLTTHRVIIKLVNGATERFASPHVTECRALVAAIEARARNR